MDTGKEDSPGPEARGAAMISGGWREGKSRAARRREGWGDLGSYL